MRRATAGSRGWHVVGDRVARRWRVGAVGYHRGRVVAQAKNPAAVAELFGARAEARGVAARVGDDGLRERAPLGLVGVQQAGTGPSGDRAGQLPGQVVHVLNADIQRLAAGRRDEMGGVAGEEDPSLAEALGYGGRDRPRHGREHLHIEVWIPDCRADKPDTAFGGEVLRPLTLARMERRHVQPQVGEIHRGHDTGPLWR